MFFSHNYTVSISIAIVLAECGFLQMFLLNVVVFDNCKINYVVTPILFTNSYQGRPHRLGIHSLVISDVASGLCLSKPLVYLTLCLIPSVLSVSM